VNRSSVQFMCLVHSYARAWFAKGDDISRVRAGISARSRAQDASVYLHARWSHLPQGRSRTRDVYHCWWPSRSHQVRISTWSFIVSYKKLDRSHTVALWTVDSNFYKHLSVVTTCFTLCAVCVDITSVSVNLYTNVICLLCNSFKIIVDSSVYHFSDTVVCSRPRYLGCNAVWWKAMEW